MVIKTKKDRRPMNNIYFNLILIVVIIIIIRITIITMYTLFTIASNK
jgi:hypothetical protein